MAVHPLWTFGGPGLIAPDVADGIGDVHRVVGRGARDTELGEDDGIEAILSLLAVCKSSLG
jgi:hypothetical protein